MDFGRSGWSIKQDILNPTKITLTPGLTAMKAIVQFDLFDRLGCKTSCVKEFNAIRNSDLNSFQFNDDATYELDQTGLVLKRDGLVCGYLMGMMKLEPDVIWERPYSLADVEALNTIQGDPTLS